LSKSFQIQLKLYFSQAILTGPATQAVLSASRPEDHRSATVFFANVAAFIAVKPGKFYDAISVEVDRTETMQIQNAYVV